MTKEERIEYFIKDSVADFKKLYCFTKNIKRRIENTLSDLVDDDKFINELTQRADKLHTCLINCLIDENTDKKNFSFDDNSFGKANLFIKSDEKFIINKKTVDTILIPRVLSELKGREIFCIGWYKLIKKIIKNDLGQDEVKKGICMIFETSETTRIICEEIIETESGIDENGKLIEASISFGEEIQLEETEKFKNNFKELLISSSVAGRNKFSESLFKKFEVNLNDVNYN